jgi:DNA-binding response OmpR family regulator
MSGESLISMTEDEAAANENTLLLVEDNPDMRAFIRDTLVGHYRIIEAGDGQEGVDKAFQSIPDIIISDVMMPRMDGLQLCEILKQDERTSHIPVILLTAKASIDSRLAGLKRGADEYLAKPFHREELLIRSRNLLDVRQRLRDRYSSLQPPAPAEDESVRIEDAFLLKVTGIVDEHLSESDFEIDELSRLVGMSRSQMFRKIKALTGQSPSLFIRNIRLQRGKVLLESTGMNISEVAYEVGFSTPTYFSDAFTQAFGFRPSQLRK